jgi:hypothetical protein
VYATMSPGSASGSTHTSPVCLDGSRLTGSPTQPGHAVKNPAEPGLARWAAMVDYHRTLHLAGL